MTRLTLITWLAAMLALGAGVWLCAGSIAPVPRVKLSSPKGAEFARSLAKVPLIVVPFIKNGNLVWDKPAGTNSTRFAVYSRTSLQTPWFLLSRMTNSYSLPITMTNAMRFYCVAAF